mmetsp:Transcript_17857/g.34803  ORF Transcript_17857/g.34803 Transcript_17857/m.34803 type:complete len:106 (-) Transcript_17857:533-850(-)
MSHGATLSPKHLRGAKTGSAVACVADAITDEAVVVETVVTVSHCVPLECPGSAVTTDTAYSQQPPNAWAVPDCLDIEVKQLTVALLLIWPGRVGRPLPMGSLVIP